jgi:tetratricopeptide (TPR) repeat protein
MKTNVCLNMIVKNEAKTLPRLFESLHRYIDYFVIYDTGSDDDTIEVIKKISDKFEIKGEIYQSEWIDFATNRNLALSKGYESRKLGRHTCNWLLFIDADEELIVENPSIFSSLKSSVTYCLYKNDLGILFKKRSLISLEQPNWYWKGAIHNYLVNVSQANMKIEFIPEIFIKCNNFEGAKSHKFSGPKEKSASDVIMLEEELRSEIVNSGNLHRYTQLANECYESEQFEKASKYYTLVIENSDKFLDVQYTSLIQLSHIYFENFRDEETSKKVLLKAIGILSNRKEAYYFLAKIYQANREFNTAKEFLEKANELPKNFSNFDFVDLNVYTWKIEFELAFIYYNLKQVEQLKKVLIELDCNAYIPKNKKCFLDALNQRI